VADRAKEEQQAERGGRDGPESDLLRATEAAPRAQERLENGLQSIHW
jgi:hypothetical protein